MPVGVTISKEYASPPDSWRSPKRSVNELVVAVVKVTVVLLLRAHCVPWLLVAHMVVAGGAKRNEDMIFSDC